MQDEGLYLFRRHDHPVKTSRISNGIAEREIIHRRCFDGIERDSVIQQHGKHVMHGVRSGLHDFAVFIIADDDVRGNRSRGQRISNCKRKTRLRIDCDFESIFIFAMDEDDCIGSKEARFGGNSPVFTFRQSFGDACAFVIGRFADFRFSIGFCVDVLQCDMCSRQRFSRFEVIGIDIEKRLSVFYALPFRRLVFRSFFLLRLSFLYFAFPLGFRFLFRAFLRGCERIGVHAPYK